MDACVKALLCGLGGGVLAGLNAILDAQKGVLTAQLATVSASLAIVNITTAPLGALLSVAEGVADAALSVTNIVPVTLMEGCADIGDVMGGVRASVEASLADTTNFIQDLNRKLSLKAELEAAQAAIQATIDTITEFQVEIGGCP